MKLKETKRGMGGSRNGKGRSETTAILKSDSNSSRRQTDKTVCAVEVANIFECRYCGGTGSIGWAQEEPPTVCPDCGGHGSY